MGSPSHPLRVGEKEIYSPLDVQWVISVSTTDTVTHCSVSGLTSYEASQVGSAQKGPDRGFAKRPDRWALASG